MPARSVDTWQSPADGSFQVKAEFKTFLLVMGEGFLVMGFVFGFWATWLSVFSSWGISR